MHIGRSYYLLLVVLLSACAPRAPATEYVRHASYAIADTSDTKLAHAYVQEAKRHPGQSGFHLLPTGSEALMMRIALVEASQRSIDMQYYITEDDRTGKLLLQAVLRAADRGVHVRMLLDDWSLDDFEAGAVALNAHPNIEIRVFNPYSTRDQSVFSRIGNLYSYLDQFSRRMHNKALVVDNQAAIMGGRNLGDEYFEASKDVNFRDIDVFAVGKVVPSISKNFDRYWNSDESFPVAMLNLPEENQQMVAAMREDMRAHWEKMRTTKAGRGLENLQLPHDVKNGTVPLDWAQAELASDRPEKLDVPDEKASSAPGLRINQLTEKAQREFIIFTPYFVPLDDGVEWLTALVKRGVRVRIITNSLASTDVVPAQAGYGHYREALLRGGVEIYESKALTRPRAKQMFKPSSQNALHTKLYMVDRKDVVVGSFNLDPRSLQFNTEQVLVIHSAALGAKVARQFEEAIAPEDSYRVVLDENGKTVWLSQEDGKMVQYDFNPHAGFIRRVTDGFFSLLPIDDKL
jgi:putative cardiolipin synthase